MYNFFNADVLNRTTCNLELYLACNLRGQVCGSWRKTITEKLNQLGHSFNC